VEAVGAIGLDGEGDLILREFAAYKNIDVSHVKREGQTSFTDVLYERRPRRAPFWCSAARATPLMWTMCRWTS
jgi:hypothetical protein